jgi:hypothetical protein
MDKKSFRVPLSIETGTPGRFKTFATVAEAAMFLLEEWPGERTPELLAAQSACLSALGGEVEAEEAREAIITAAKANDLFTRDDDRPRSGR